MRENICFYGLLIGLGLVAGYIGLSYIGLGVLLGIMFAIAYRVTSDGRDAPIVLGIGITIIGIIGFIASFFIAKDYGMTFEELYNSRPRARFGRRLPLYTVTALTTGILLIAYTLLGKLSEKYA